MVYFNLTEEVVETIGTFVLKTLFGEANITNDETVSTHADGLQKTVPFSVAFRIVWS